MLADFNKQLEKAKDEMAQLVAEKGALEEKVHQFLVFLCGSIKTILRVKRSFGVILAIFDKFCKTEKARICAISWADIGRV